MKKISNIPIVIGIVAVLLLVSCSGPNDSTASDPLLSDPTPGNEKAFTAFGFTAASNAALLSDVAGTVSGSTVSATVPYGTDVSALVATFTASGTAIAVGGTAQISGTTANDFTSSVTYTVTAEDSSTQDYTVTITIAIAAAEGAGFGSASSLGDTGVLTLPESAQNLTMIYANGSTSITFPTASEDITTKTLTTRFWMGETEVTSAVMAAVFQWAYDNEQFSTTIADHNGLDETMAKHGGQLLLNLGSTDCHVIFNESEGTFTAEDGYENNPVTNVSWYGAVMFCNWLTEMRDGNTANVVYTTIDTDWLDEETTETASNTGYRLPSDPEWEYAARYRGSDTTNVVTGTIYGTDFDAMTTKWTKGNSASNATTFYNDDSGSGGDPGKSANDAVAMYRRYWDGAWADNETSDEAVVKSLGINSANVLGIYDMSGNVAEWCFEEFQQKRLIRGGYWNLSAYYLQVGYSEDGNPTDMTWSLGFRLCRTAD